MIDHQTLQITTNHRLVSLDELVNCRRPENLGVRFHYLPLKETRMLIIILNIIFLTKAIKNNLFGNLNVRLQ